jgi:hypothetical protein
MILDLTHDDFFESRISIFPEDILAVKLKWREIVKEKKDSH